MPLHIAESAAFLRLNNSTVYVKDIFSVSIYPPMYTWLIPYLGYCEKTGNECGSTNT